MNRGTFVADMKKTKSIKETFKITPISNAFSLEIKNQREEAIKNMEHLRQSVKLKKRANPLEKIMNKLIGNEKDIIVPIEIQKAHSVQTANEDHNNDHAHFQNSS